MSGMTPERWRQIDQLLQAALERPSAEQAAFLAEACGGDEELRREVESLLGFHEQAEHFIESPPAEVAAHWLASKESRAGQTVGHYELVRQIGRGGMGDVYLAHDATLARNVALKLLPPRFSADTQRVQRFRQEARAVSALNHPNIITIHEVGEAETDAGSVQFIATEFIEGRTLRDVLHAGPMKVGEALEMAIQVTDALSAAHAAGITHRDIKPENIMLRPDGYVKVLDFGLAKLNERPVGGPVNPIETDPGIVLGTISYMSPEQARGGEIDARSDLFSLGVVLYEMLTSRRPFDGETPADGIAALLGPEPPNAEETAALPEPVRTLLGQVLAKDRGARIQTAEEMRRALRKLQRELTSPEDFTTREFHARSLLARRFGDTNESREYVTAAHTVHGQARVTANNARPAPAGSRLRRRLGYAAVVLGFLAVGILVGLRWSRATSGGRVESIAVLPFKPLAPESRDEALEMGIADTLITRLSYVKSLTVRPISAVWRYRGLGQDSLAAGRELQVRAVLDGNIQRVGDKIRVTARLEDTRTGKTLWTRQFDEPWTDIFAVEDAISRRVLDDLTVTLSGEERSVLARNYTTDPEAYRLYLIGNDQWNKRTPDGLRAGIAAFRLATEKDPTYALAYVGLADAYMTLASYHFAPSTEVMPPAREAVAHALQLDPGLAEAHTSMGKILSDYYWDWPQAEAEFRRAIELKPNYPNAHHWYSSLLSSLGRPEEAIREARRALELDRLSPSASTQIGAVLYRSRRYDEGAAVLRKTLELDPSFVTAHVYLGLCYLMQGRHDDAIAEFQKGHAAVPLNSDFIALLGMANGRAGRREEALRYARQLDDLSRRIYVPPFNRAGIYAGLGDLDQTFYWLDRCYAERDGSLGWMKTDPLYDVARQDPRFLPLLQRMGFAP